MKSNELENGKWVKLTQDDNGGDLKAGAVVQLIAKVNELGQDVWNVRSKEQVFYFLGLDTEVEEMRTEDTQEVQLPLRQEAPVSVPVAEESKLEPRGMTPLVRIGKRAAPVDPAVEAPQE